MNDYVEPKMKILRPGLELCYKEVPLVRPGFLPIVASHRRAGTHLLGEFVSTHWKRDWLKSHDFPERLPINEYPTFYVVRNPIDVIFSTYTWWRAGGGAFNPELETVIEPFTFEQYLRGEVGRFIGYQSWKVGIRDNCEISRGMMYDPVRYWRDHLRAYMEAGVTIITYEELVRSPRNAAEKVASVLGDLEDYSAISKIPPVGMSPSIQEIGYALPEWPDWARDYLDTLCSERFFRQLKIGSLMEWISPADE